MANRPDLSWIQDKLQALGGPLLKITCFGSHVSVANNMMRVVGALANDVATPQLVNSERHSVYVPWTKEELTPEREMLIFMGVENDVRQRSDQELLDLLTPWILKLKDIAEYDRASHPAGMTDDLVETF